MRKKKLQRKWKTEQKDKLKKNLGHNSLYYYYYHVLAKFCTQEKLCLWMVTSPTIIWLIFGGYSLNMASLYFFPHITWAQFFKKEVGFTTHLPHKFEKHTHTHTLCGGPTCFPFIEFDWIAFRKSEIFLKKWLCGFGGGVVGRRTGGCGEAHWGLRNSLSQELRWKKGPGNKGRRRGRKRRRGGSSLGGRRERKREREREKGDRSCRCNRK